MSSSYIPALKTQYLEQVFPALKESRGYKNPHQVPGLVKVAINSGFGTDLDKNQIADVLKDLATIAGQKPVTAKARKSVWQRVSTARVITPSESPTTRSSPKSRWRTSSALSVSTSPS